MKINSQTKHILTSYGQDILVVEGILAFITIEDAQFFFEYTIEEVVKYIVEGTRVPIIFSENELSNNDDLTYDKASRRLFTSDFNKCLKSKVLVSPSNFTSKQIEAIANKKLKENDLVFIKCTTRKDFTIEIDFGDNSFSKKITLVRVPESLQFSKKRVEEIANWAFSFHRKEDLNDKELEVEFKEQLEKKLNRL